MKEPKKKFVAIDAGNNSVKFHDGLKLISFPSNLGPWRERKVRGHFGNSDWEYELNGEKGFAGTLSENENELSEPRSGLTKAHKDAKIRILLALHNYADTSEPIDIVVGQPIATHSVEEKEAIKSMLVGSHELVVNGDRRIITIRHCTVTIEGIVAGLIGADPNGIIRVIDCGSGTINMGSISNGQFLDRDSDTIPKGMNNDILPKDLVEVITRKGIAKNWNATDRVRVLGGGAEIMLPYIKEEYPNATIVPNPGFANVIAFYEVARKLYA